MNDLEYSGKHEALVSPEVWQKVNDRLSQNKKAFHDKRPLTIFLQFGLIADRRYAGVVVTFLGAIFAPIFKEDYAL
mgnify:CR=1 FL=1